jgi:sigma-E factor negative regulatory protein RseB
VIRRGLLVAGAGVGVLASVPVATADAAWAFPLPRAVLPPAAPDVGPGQRPREEVQALAVLQRAVDADRRLVWTGTQYVASWRDSATESALVELTHDPVEGSTATVTDPYGVAGTAALEPPRLGLLADAYALRVAGPGRCTGREASVVEAVRTDGAVAGRFWIDRASGILLRREVYDGAGQRVRSSAYVDLQVDPAPPDAEPRSTTAGTSRDSGAVPVDAAARALLRGDGWPVADRLPQGFRLVQTRRTDEVLHLAYADGLSALSLFVQPGALGAAGMEGFTREQVDGRPVWVHHGEPARVVGSGAGRVWTLVSDAPDDAVRAAVAALPRDAEPDGGLLPRLGRGLSRLAGMLNPFD